MELVKHCHVPNCDALHNIVFIENRAVISVNEFYKIVRHWEKNVENICGEKCKKNRKILYATQTFKFCKNAKRKRFKKKQRPKKKNNKNIRNGIGKILPT